ncbi:MAG: hypothetical protein KDA74_01500, partial [Planctomycetaceae bacterium]|nr:hypothetical protein [Planctomycetaceae bacterium]
SGRAQRAGGHNSRIQSIPVHLIREIKNQPQGVSPGCFPIRLDRKIPVLLDLPLPGEVNTDKISWGRLIKSPIQTVENDFKVLSKRVFLRNSLMCRDWTIRKICIRTLGFILLCLLAGAQFVPRPGPFMMSHGSGFHVVERRIICYGWPLTFYVTWQQRSKTGANSGEGATWDYSPQKRGRFVWYDSISLF